MATLSVGQISALMGVVDVLLPALPPDPNCPDDVFRFWNHDLTRDIHFRNALLKAIHERLDPIKKAQFCFLLTVLSSPIGSWLFFFPHAGVAPPLLSFSHSSFGFAEWSREERRLALKSLQQSRFWRKRMVFNGLKRLITGIALTYVPASDEHQLVKNRPKNIFWDAMGYEGPYHWGIPPELDDKMRQNSKSLDDVLSFDSILKLPLDRNKSGPLEFDCIVIGSGCGGSVSASILSQAGYSVLLIEKGSYVSRLNTTQLEGDAYDTLYENHALQTTADGNIMIFAGSTLGGGSAINYACCIELPDEVRLEWSDLGLDHCHPNSSEFNRSQEVVLSRIGAIRNDSIHHNGMNCKLIQGSKALGHKYFETKQNLNDTKHDSAGYTCFGDRYGNKQGMPQTFLQDAVKSGCKILENAFVERILHKRLTHGIEGIHRAGAQKATGVRVRHNGQLYTIHASRCVICAAGALHTPCLLTRSGFKNPHIGKNLHLHPVTAAYGSYQHDVKGWLGAPMTSCNVEFMSGPNHDGYGARIECPPVHPGVAAAGGPWQDCIQFKKSLLSAKNLVLAITLQRDIGSGRVRQGPGETVIVDYELHPSDKKSIVAALQGLIQILISSGAERVSTMHDNDQGFDLKLSNVDNLATLDLLAQKSVQNYLQIVEKLHTAMKKHETLLLSAHQMGTCRFGVTPQQSACDENGELWECDNLYVTDTSIFPTASGSNPMVTVLTLSNMLCNRLLKRLKYEDYFLARGQVSGATSKETEGLQFFESRWKKRVGEYAILFPNSCTFLLCLGVIGIVLAFVAHWYESFFKKHT